MATIIIQENDSAVLDVITQALALENHRPIPILGSCPEEMSSAIRRFRPDLVLVDHHAGLKSWSVLLGSIRKISRALPVVALSCDLHIAKIADRIGFNGFLSKPFDLDELFQKVEALLSGTPERPNFIV